MIPPEKETEKTVHRRELKKIHDTRMVFPRAITSIAGCGGAGIGNDNGKSNGASAYDCSNSGANDDGEINAWDDPQIFQAIQTTGRKQIVMTDIVTLNVRASYEVFAVLDASATFSRRVRNFALAQMVQTGVQPMSFFSVVTELARA
ncbi:hypothetical protein K7432_013018 [Basidiobolus ranarum]|uniref:Uncharacterized protein n=1 Tax=Basidiobolus ranarum TaxID=34480 RepID=A0ABR2VSB5_9FUNG